MRIDKSSALIIVDVQNDFMPPDGALAVPDGDKIIQNINQYIEKFRDLPVFATADWHPQDHISFKERGGPWPPHCVQNTKGAEFHKDLRLPENTYVIRKAYDSEKDAYSGFEETELAQKLKDLGVTTVFVCGVATEYCVKNTVLDAIKHGFKTYVLKDAIKGINEADSTAALEEMSQAGAILVELEDIKETSGIQQIVKEGIDQMAEKIKETSEQLIKDISKEIKKKSKKISKDIKKIVKKSKKDISKLLEKEKKEEKKSKAAQFVADAIKRVAEKLIRDEKTKRKRKTKATKRYLETKKTKTKNTNLPRGKPRGKPKKEKGGGKTMATTKKGSAKPKQKAKCKKTTPKKK